MIAAAIETRGRQAGQETAEAARDGKTYRGIYSSGNAMYLNDVVTGAATVQYVPRLVDASMRRSSLLLPTLFTFIIVAGGKTSAVSFPWPHRSGHTATDLRIRNPRFLVPLRPVRHPGIHNPLISTSMPFSVFPCLPCREKCHIIDYRNCECVLVLSCDDK